MCEAWFGHNSDMCKMFVSLVKSSVIQKNVVLDGLNEKGCGYYQDMYAGGLFLSDVVYGCVRSPENSTMRKRYAWPRT